MTTWTDELLLALEPEPDEAAVVERLIVEAWEETSS
jgi:hypothetical protein